MKHHQLSFLTESLLMGVTLLEISFKYLLFLQWRTKGLTEFIYFQNYYHLQTKFEMTRSVNKTKQYTVLLEETLFWCYLTLLGSVHVKWSGRIQVIKENMDTVIRWTWISEQQKADNLIDGCIMALKNNSGKYAFVSCYFILHYRHHIVCFFFTHNTLQSPLRKWCNQTAK